jgi:hypothetical protein
MHHCPFCKPSRAMPEWKGNHGRIWSSGLCPAPSNDIEPLVAAKLPGNGLKRRHGNCRNLLTGNLG